MDASIWDQILSRIETKVNRHSFYTWFKPTSFVARRRRFHHASGSRTSSSRTGSTKHYSVVLSEALDRSPASGSRRSCSSPEGVAAPGAAAGRRSPPAATERPEAAGRRQPPTALGGLNQRYTFDTFIVGPSNQFAHAACRAVAEAPSRSYNPLFIYGGVGLGKTHLMHAVGQYVLQHDPSLKLTYISSERFMNEMINALRYDRILDFRERYRSVDVLLVDDIQFVSGKEGTQTEFFHTFNALYDAQKQIVLSSDRPPHEIPALEERLRSRFEWGLIADIQPPDHRDEGRDSQAKSRSRGRAAARQRGDVHRRPHQVEHPRARGIADPADRLRLADRPRDLARADAGSAERTSSTRTTRRSRSRRIQKFVADYYQLKVVELKSRNNSKSVAMPRQIAMYLCKSLTHASLPEIGRSFGGKHHSTVIHSIKKVEELRKSDGDFNSLIASFLESFR